MGHVRTVSSIAAIAVLGALFGRRGRRDGHGEDVGEPVPAPAEQPGGPPTDHFYDAATDDSSTDGAHGLKPVPHPIRPWELWHPAVEPSHLFHHDPEERVSWQEVADSDDPATGGALWDAPDLTAEAERFGFGRLRPFTRSVLDHPQDLLAPTPVHPDPEQDEPQGSVHPPSGLEGDLSVADHQTSVGAAGLSSTPDEGDVLFRELVSPERMTASEHALEDQDQDRRSTAGLLINGPVSRRADRDPDRTRRRLPVDLRVVEGETPATAD